MQFRVLGAVELWDGDGRVDLGPMKQRMVLAVLLADVGRAVSPEALIDRVWGDRAPAQARNVLHTYVARLRSLLGRLGDDPPRLVRQPTGYRLDAGAATVDLHRFRALVDSAAGGTAEQRAGLLGEAVEVWGGEPLDGMEGAWADECRALWRTEHRDATVRWAGLLLELGRAAASVGPLEHLAERYPLVEPVIDALMRAMHAAGRGPEALDRYERLRRLLADELGADPGPGLQQLHQSILRGEFGGPGVDPAAQLPLGVASSVDAHMLELMVKSAVEAAAPLIQRQAQIDSEQLNRAIEGAVVAVRREFEDNAVYVSLSGIDPDRLGGIAIPVHDGSTVSDLLNEVWFRIADYVPAYTYGETWELAKSDASGTRRIIEALPPPGVPDVRKLKEVGVVGTDRLVARLLGGASGAVDRDAGR
ncbi:BTAD domain-containing putative transcriptional regulator [Dactylosporangium sp. NPDC048998]|uniref:AfsR/SARP family transcriptional regulator n=1 Tax=Dactylosporangium sp. NPDC048998 TaxID=3363976 RepID=UPI003722F94C